MTIPKEFGLYAILTDPVKGYEYMAKLFVDHKVAFLQLRMKKAPPEVILKQALKIAAITRGSATRFIVNDDPEIAVKAGADGVHIGQSDLPYDKVREIVGPDAIIGLSTHSPQQVLDACRVLPSYIGTGPVYPTPTKSIPDPAIGLDGLKTMLDAALVPAVAIGGIDLSNLRGVLEAGAKNFCMVRQLMQADDPEKVLKEMAVIYREYC